MFSFSSPPQLQPTYFAIPSRPHFCSPQTPSPLRTSRNANLMHPANDTAAKSALGSSPLSAATDTDDDENAFQFSPMASSQTPTLKPNQMEDSNCTHTPPTASSIASTFSINLLPINSTKSAFTFESRARSSSPSTQMQTRTQDSRSKRKTVFLDRIRNRRDEQRGNAMGDQVLRMDFVRERRMWEEEMARRAAEDELEDFGMGDLLRETSADDNMQDPEEMSPTEDKEVEELVSYIASDGRASQEVQVARARATLADETMLEDDDDDYDALFMEVIGSQGQAPQIHGCDTEAGMSVSAAAAAQSSQQIHGHGGGSEITDTNADVEMS